MIRFLRLFIPLALLASFAFAQNLEGAWRGALGPGVIDLEIVVTFTDGGNAGTIDIPAQGLLAYPLASIAREGDRVTFALPGIPGDPQFDGLLTLDTLEGTFTQSGQALPFELRRSEIAAPLRPQEPLPPFPYRTEEVVVAAAVPLAGTLTLPEGSGTHPALVLLTGSGAQDRDEAILGHKPFLVIADHLTRAGFAVLRLDDRGVGGSGGSDAQATYDDLAADALAAVAFLRAHPRVNASQVGLLGHSQGGYVAPLAAARSDAAVAFVVLVAAPAVDGYALLVAQNERLIEVAMRTEDPTVDPVAVEGVVAEQLGFLAALAPLIAADDRAGVADLIAERVETQVASLPAEQRPDADTLAALVAAEIETSTSPVFRALLTFDPTPYLRALTVPTLALYGERDLQVPADQNAGAMRAALARGRDATVVTLPGLNHLMQPAVTGSPDEYGSIAVTVDPTALAAITDWLAGRFGAR